MERRRSEERRVGGEGRSDVCSSGLSSGRNRRGDRRRDRLPAGVARRLSGCDGAHPPDLWRGGGRKSGVWGERGGQTCALRVCPRDEPVAVIVDATGSQRASLAVYRTVMERIRQIYGEAEVGRAACGGRGEVRRVLFGSVLGTNPSR